MLSIDVSYDDMNVYVMLLVTKHVILRRCWNNFIL